MREWLEIQQVAVANGISRAQAETVLEQAPGEWYEKVYCRCMEPPATILKEGHSLPEDWVCPECDRNEGDALYRERFKLLPEGMRREDVLKEILGRAQKMTKEQLAAMINGREIGEEITVEIEALAKESRLVIVFGYSDDGTEFRGAMHDEKGGGSEYGPMTLSIIGDELLSQEELEQAEKTLNRLNMTMPPPIQVTSHWCPEELDTSWLITANVPYASFDIFEDGELYCRGCVFALMSAPLIKEPPITETTDSRADGGNCVLQPWVMRLPFMMQSVLISAVRGPDGIEKYHDSKYVVRWLRRCILTTSFEGGVLEDPFCDGGGSFTGPITPRFNSLQELKDGFFRCADGLPSHFISHLRHAVEILGYHHPKDEIREFWFGLYSDMCKDMHLLPEPKEVLDKRLSGVRENWLEHTLSGLTT